MAAGPASRNRGRGWQAMPDRGVDVSPAPERGGARGGAAQRFEHALLLPGRPARAAGRAAGQKALDVGAH